MREISDISYMKKIASPIEFEIEETLFDLFNRKANEFGFEPVSLDEFHSYYWDGYVGEIRHLVIRLYEQLGMDVRDETGEEW